ncbi:MAG: tungstate transport system substrate-binding protein [Petroclostridium sp.]|uniref:substrate-binding domain-containing protein n=1 Tax=Petroclostridium xylanilyticum TaxID=1792311 RepID=UPI0018E33CCD|nr:substrate-binding domain-containing protein [Petroclostridium xylanilyticum]MBZ4646768.1 extracellular solute-binding protein [Clostridia bacterium]MDK2809502.1 tungstate transport system substrate-binding protein [Petroclostridium sp.]
MKRTCAIITMILIITIFAGCSVAATKESPAPVNETPAAGNETGKESQQPSSIILATTTSTRDSGLLDYLLPAFEKDTNIQVKVIAVGTGKALQMGKDGEADVLLVHAKSSEEQFVKEGHGLERFDVMYNDFVLVGPKDDPLKLKEKCPNNIVESFKLINQNQYKFISRGDQSGTHQNELSHWKASGIEPKGDFYVSAGSGMGEVLKMADDVNAYTLTDRATYLSMKGTLDLEIVVEKDGRLFNQYGVIAVNPEKNKNINREGAEQFVNWILSEKAQKMIGEFGKDKFGEPLFTPNAKK